MRKTWAVGLAAGLLSGLPAWAVHRCTLADGQVVYQDALCPAATAASQVRLFTSPPDPAGRRRAAADVQAAAKLSQAEAVVPAPAMALTQPAAPVARSPIAALADACLDWYRPLLRDPRGAYWRDASVDKLDVLHLTIYATNGFGGYVSKAAACEVRNGAIDHGWTRTHAGRLGW